MAIPEIGLEQALNTYPLVRVNTLTEKYKQSWFSNQFYRAMNFPERGKTFNIRAQNTSSRDNQIYRFTMI